MLKKKKTLKGGWGGKWISLNCEVGQIYRYLYFPLSCLFLIYHSPQYYKLSSFRSTTFKFQKDTLEQGICTDCFSWKRWNKIHGLFFSSALHYLINGVENGNPFVFLPEKSHGQRNQMVYAPWGYIESEKTENTLALIT